jgi:hypothetical protein
MRLLLIAAFEDAISQIRAEEVRMPLDRWNESVFRFFYSRSVTLLEPGVTQLVECNRIDLVLHRGNERAFVEFKFYTHSVRHDAVAGNQTGMKGFPSIKNRLEFNNCVDMLRLRPEPPGGLKVVARFYADPVVANQKTYEEYYGDDSGIEDELKISRLASIGPFPSHDLQNTCHARLYEVGS